MNAVVPNPNVKSIQDGLCTRIRLCFQEQWITAWMSAPCPIWLPLGGVLTVFGNRVDPQYFLGAMAVLIWDQITKERSLFA